MLLDKGKAQTKYIKRNNQPSDDRLVSECRQHVFGLIALPLSQSTSKMLLLNDLKFNYFNSFH